VKIEAPVTRVLLSFLEGGEDFFSKLGDVVRHWTLIVNRLVPQVKGILRNLFTSGTSCVMKNSVSVATRLNRQQFEKLLRRQKALKRSTGVKISISAVMRLLVDEAKDVEPKQEER
jgi:hypothetical protein